MRKATTRKSRLDIRAACDLFEELRKIIERSKTSVGSFFETYMTKDEKKLKLMLMRNFKVKLATLSTVSQNFLTRTKGPRKFSQLEIDTMGCYLDKDEEGLIRISDLENACQFPHKYTPFYAEVVEVKEELEESILNVLDLFRPMNLIFNQMMVTPDQVFTRYDSNKNYLLSAAETAKLLKRYLGLD